MRPSSDRVSPTLSNSGQRNRALSASKHLATGDSSDEEVPEPKFSASVRALLEGDALGVETSPGREASANRPISLANGNTSSAATRPERRVRVASPNPQSSGSPPPRVVRVGSMHITSKAEDVGSEPREVENDKDLITPAPRTRSVRIMSSRSSRSSRSHTHSPTSTSPSHKTLSGRESPEDHKTTDFSGDEHRGHREEDYVPRVGTGMHSSLRVKRVGRLTGSFLNGPARRGVLRMRSDEIDKSSPEEKKRSDGASAKPDMEANNRHDNLNNKIITRAAPAKLTWIDSDPQGPAEEPKPLPAAVNVSVVDIPFSSYSSAKSSGSQSKSSLKTNSDGSSQSTDGREQPVFKVHPLPPMPAARDQENEPPPTFKRAKPQGFSFLDKPNKFSVIYDEDRKVPNAPVAINSSRKPLVSLNNNTPHRAPPPPPKMSVLETATATGGAATASQSRKKRSQVSINHKTFTRMDCIGRGGSSRVYRVMAENYKIFALKRVNLEDVDGLTLAGYKGEIDLLKRLENVDRVVRLFDWELNSGKHTLSVLMEIGESDLEKILTDRLNSEDAVFDMSFTRHYWKEMLECVQAVHKFNIVHSDLKPANFLLVQGRLKLIDFGIANAIQDDTINVHREHQVGTPNYMSPEALIDSNAALGLPATVGKMMKLGKPSDVWSLGCILYKMVYGQPPFARITKCYERIMAIPNPKVPIEFPQFAIGGACVSPGLLRTMKRCLQRDQTLRPTVEELLSERDPFLYPETQLEGTVPVTQEILSRILTNVVNHCRARGVPKDEELAAWPAGFFIKIKAALEDEHAR
ncbi:hypothetical protein Egran_03946 [Elaphomyces granulatus]|uniref:Protein kinase domain-containing protein n=1 Tax=Elaphomyces granulatus TaxID=519963 RepID=A0A232LW01_9EURO|nr:hypothetical protein Egran_03946 [Elaphomyces granulatus]